MGLDSRREVLVQLGVRPGHAWGVGGPQQPLQVGSNGLNVASSMGTAPGPEEGATATAGCVPVLLQVGCSDAGTPDGLLIVGGLRLGRPQLGARLDVGDDLRLLDLRVTHRTPNPWNHPDGLELRP